MRKITSISILVFLSACANVKTPNGDLQWDFDHNIRFKETQIADNEYYLQVIPKQDTKFSKLATFILRRSFELCKSYGFKMEVLKGVQTFDEKVVFQSQIMDSLSANIQCPPQKIEPIKSKLQF